MAERAILRRLVAFGLKGETGLNMLAAVPDPQLGY
jgi:hypothetical protein